MHTALCAFDDRASAEQARERLLQAGFARQDVHLQHRDSHLPAEEHEVRGNWEGMEREVAVDRHVLESIGAFFVSLFGQDHPHGRTYAEATVQGRTVVVVDAGDAAEAERARDLMRELKAGHLNVVHRSAQPPLRDLVAEEPVHVESPEAIQAAMHGRSTDWSARMQTPRERAMASGSAEASRPAAGAAGADPAAGRDAAGEAAKPDGNRDGLGRTRRDE